MSVVGIGLRLGPLRLMNSNNITTYAMPTEGLRILKRDGREEPFELEKIKSAIRKAFLSTNSFVTEEALSTILSRVRIMNGMTVEEIQDQVETALMAERYFVVAKSYILYRQKHSEDRETREKVSFLTNYCDASNAATGSKYDANANVERKNIATLIGELPKSGFIRLNRRLLTDRIKKMYGKQLADEYIDLLTSEQSPEFSATLTSRTTLRLRTSRIRSRNR